MAPLVQFKTLTFLPTSPTIQESPISPVKVQREATRSSRIEKALTIEKLERKISPKTTFFTLKLNSKIPWAGAQICK